MKVLVADDDPVTRRKLRGLLQYLGHDPVEAADGREAWAVLDGVDAPDLVILDWMMPALSGVEICRRLRHGAKRRYQYVLMLTARDLMDDLVEAMESGADDFLRKPFDLRELRVRVRAAERLLAAQDELRAHAITDDLTGLLNRRGVLDRLRHELALSQRDGRPLSVAVIDVDRFKAINDAYGHAVGDEVLREVGRRMHAQLRGYDDLGRHGGEEFALILPGCDASGARSVAERIRAAICGEPVRTSAAPIDVSVSAGVAAVDPYLGEDVTGVVARADRALYRAKRAGRNRVELANPEIAEAH
ncbi:MAG TPA: diguanylate cyclase [Burkholderiales bacterium]|nr:diguanylate cyclase [Burkholderiales bacterium]